MRGGCRASPPVATVSRRRAGPPAPHPRTRRTARSGGRARRGPAAPARATGPGGGPRSSHLLARGNHEGAQLDGPVARIGPADGDLGRALERLALEQAIADEMLLGLDEGAVGDRRHAVAHAHGLRLRRVGQAVSGEQLARLGQLVHDRGGVVHDRVALAFGQRLPVGGVLVDEQHVLQRSRSFRAASRYGSLVLAGRSGSGYFDMASVGDSRLTATRVPELVPIRNGRMAMSPFTFYRGAAYVMASDLASN